MEVRDEKDGMVLGPYWMMGDIKVDAHTGKWWRL
jgi:hypothetical protein